jgi:signal transduction histidine kinase
MYQKDPLLFTQPYSSQPDPMAQLEEEKRKLEEKMSQLRQSGPQQQMRPQTPVWDEIDTIVSGLSDQELQFLNSNQEFQESSASVQAILQREYLRIMRPVVESTKDGKQALENHLTLIKRLRNYARDEVNKKYSLFDEYMEKYSDMSFAEFMEMKKGKKRGGPAK